MDIKSADEQEHEFNSLLVEQQTVELNTKVIALEQEIYDLRKYIEYMESELMGLIRSKLDDFSYDMQDMYYDFKKHTNSFHSHLIVANKDEKTEESTPYRESVGKIVKGEDNLC